MNPYLKTLFQNLIGAEQQLAELRKNAQKVKQGHDNYEIAGLCKDAGMDQDRQLLVKAEVDKLVAAIYTAERQGERDAVNCAIAKRDAAEVAIETYMSIHYKFTEPD